MDKWDVPASRPRLKGGNIPLCDLSTRLALHQFGNLVYFSHYKRTKSGIPFSEIKQSAEIAKEFAAICQMISDRLGIPFYADAVQCINRNRLDPEFHLLRPIAERRVIVYDDIITTGTTLTATASLLADRDFVLNLIGINNR